MIVLFMESKTIGENISLIIAGCMAIIIGVMVLNTHSESLSVTDALICAFFASWGLSIAGPALNRTIDIMVVALKENKNPTQL